MKFRPTKLLFLVLLMSLVLASTSGCVILRTVDNTNRGIVLMDGVSISKVVMPGRYSFWTWYARMDEVNVTNKTINWEDPSLVTKDKQPIGMKLTVTYSRTATEVDKMYMDYRDEAKNDKQLAELVLTRVPQVAKSVSASYSLDQMLGISGDITRDEVASVMKDMLGVQLAQIYVDIISVQIGDIAVSESYMDMLNQKAAAQLEVELAKQKTLTLAETLKQVEAQNKINLSQAVNANEVAAESAKALSDDRLFKLKYLEALAKVFGPNAKVVFIPSDSDLSIITNTTGDGPVIPVQ
jgi:regulator of protease activity HflC (stomatin/prohibitin superfamily)